jgi:hypothetical protein
MEYSENGGETWDNSGATIESAVGSVKFKSAVEIRD